MTDRSLHVSLALRREGPAGCFEIDVEFRAPPGITILFGESGCGKSTILRTIAGLLSPDAGYVRLGEDSWFDKKANINRPPNTRGLAYVFQSLALFPHMTAVANVAYGLSRDLSRQDMIQTAMAALDRLGVAHLAGRKPRTFSGGEAQRVALARGLARSPQLILLDEPFSALDQKRRAQLVRLVRELVDDLGVPLVQVTHDRREARTLGDRVLLIKDGRIENQGKPEDVLGPSLRVEDSYPSGDQ